MAQWGRQPFSKTDFLFAKRIDLEDLPKDSLIRTAYAFWRALAPEPSLPARSDFDATDVPRKIMPWVFLHKVVRNENGTLDYRCKLMGTSAVATIGFDPTGHLNTEYFSTPELRYLNESLDLTVHQAIPTFWKAGIPHARYETVAVWRGIFPLASDRKTVNMILGIGEPRRLSGDMK
ncbi:PAS domain-containing protein [Nisaea sp.]|uniref:PAS domain-containing protein n=1 Tax=Nisaea sp. TaxID=2024842 RepID=UPI002B26DCA1|nr:PAS domain-containing protein [Nisaea sp.]